MLTLNPKLLLQRALHAAAALIVVAAIPACGGDEATNPDHGHTPASIKLFTSTGQELNLANVVLPAGQTTRVEVRFFADDGDPITGLEAGHDVALTFSPAALASAAAVATEKFQAISRRAPQAGQVPSRLAMDMTATPAS